MGQHDHTTMLNSYRHVKCVADFLPSLWTEVIGTISRSNIVYAVALQPHTGHIYSQ